MSGYSNILSLKRAGCLRTCCKPNSVLHSSDLIAPVWKNRSDISWMRADARCFRSVATCSSVPTLYPTWRRGAHSINYTQDPHLSLIMLFYGRLLTDAVIACLSHSSPFHPFIFSQNSKWRNSSVGPCYFSYITIIFSRPFIATVRTFPPFMSSIPQRWESGGGGNQAEIHSPLFQFLFNATLTALQMSAKHARMLLFSSSNINLQLSVCSNSGLPQPVYFADRLTDRTRERGTVCVCVACCGCHILDCCTSFFMQSRRL